MTGPSAAAVEAAAEAMWRRDGFTHWADDLPDVGQAVYAANARAALSAALPIIREEIATELERRASGGTAYIAAARIVRAGEFA